jgi:hypothetical protein
VECEEWSVRIGVKCEVGVEECGNVECGGA